MKVSIIGSGYVGLVTAACLAEKGHEVVCVDIDQATVDTINRRQSPIHEEGLNELLQRHVGERLRATTELRKSVLETDVSMLAVGTPYVGDSIDLTYIETASRQIGEALREKDGYHLVIVKSTVIPGTTDGVVLSILEETSGRRAGESLGIGMNPEFLREGCAVDDFMNPDRIVVGGIDQKALDEMSRLYDCFEGVDIIRTTPKTAEMIKYTVNSLLATMISFSNEVGNLCTALGDLDIVDVMHGVHLDKRLNPVMSDGTRVEPGLLSYLKSGCGFGGSCFPKDVKALIAHGRREGSEMAVLEAVVRVNERQPMEVLQLLEQHFDSLTGLHVAVLGLAFKPATDDMRESPAIPIVRALQKARATVHAYDPAHPAAAQELFGTRNIRYCQTLFEAVEGCDALVVLTEWDEFLALPEILDCEKANPLVIDGRRMFSKDRIQKYEGIGLRAKHTYNRLKSGTAASLLCTVGVELQETLLVSASWLGFMAA